MHRHQHRIVAQLHSRQVTHMLAQDVMHLPSQLPVRGSQRVSQQGGDALCLGCSEQCHELRSVAPIPVREGGPGKQGGESRAPFETTPPPSIGKGPVRLFPPIDQQHR
jgi:hypothetical protein